MSSSVQRAGYANLSSMQLVFGFNAYHQVWPNGGGYFAGSVDEVATFNRALAITEVRQMFAAGVAGGA
jgi:hypothetical protein